MKRIISAIVTSVGLLWPSIVTSVLLAALLIFPPQTHELYRILAQGDEWLHLIEFGLSLALAAYWICLIGQALVQTVTTGKQAPGKFEGWLLRNIPVVLGAAVFVEAGTGLVMAASDAPAISLSAASAARSTSLAQINSVTADGRHTSAVLWRVALFFFIFVALALWRMRAPAGSRREDWAKWISGHWGRVFFVAVGTQLLLSCLFSISTAIPIALGSLTIIDLFCLLLVTVIAGLRVGFFRFRVPFLTLLLCAAILFSILGWNDNHQVEETRLATPVPAFNAAGPQLVFEQWFKTRKDLQFFEDLNRPYPILIIAARGGGMYAAAQEAIFLSRMQDQCPTFAQHVFAISGVSGGSIGASLFTNLAQQNAQNVAMTECAFGEPVTGNMEMQTRLFLKRDFLAPILAAALFSDLDQRFFPIPIRRSDRGNALSTGLEAAWRDLQKDKTNLYEQNFLNQWKADQAVPALLINTTQADNGRSVTISPFAINPLSAMNGGQPQSWFYQTDAMNQALPTGITDPLVRSDIKTSEAVGMSARFPWLLPAAAIKRDKKTMRLIDGGYFDNSGIETALALIEDLVTVRAGHEASGENSGGQNEYFDFDIHLIVISGSLEDEAPGWQGLDDLLTPVRGLLSTRTSRGALTEIKAQTARYFYCSYKQPCPRAPYDIRPAATLEDQDMALALGFQLSNSSLDLIGAEAGQASQCGRILGPSDVQSREGQDQSISVVQRRVMEYMHGNSCSPCMMKYWLSGMELPNSPSYPCDQTPALQKPSNKDSEKQPAAPNREHRGVAQQRAGIPPREHH